MKKTVFVKFCTSTIFAIGMILPLFANSVMYHFLVAKDGTGDFKTVQEAINAVPNLRNKRTVIYIKEGVYKEKLTLPATKTNVSLIGEDNKKTILTYDDYASKKNDYGEDIGTSGSASVFIFGDGFYAENITFENSAGPVGQAVAVRVTGDRAYFENCRFLGFQDTLYPHGVGSRQYYRNCYIEGTTDFIFGSATALFRSCEINSKPGGSYITAASTPDTTRYGFVFKDCRLVGDVKESSTYLGRPWRPYAKTVFINCYLDKQIKAEGWQNWGKENNEKTAYYAELNSKGPGAVQLGRVDWSLQLSEKDMDYYSDEKILQGWDLKIQ